MIPDCCTKGMALEGWSATSTPTNWTVEPLACSALAVWARRGVSFWQGVHHEAKKLSTTGRLRSLPSASRLTGAPPRRAGMVKSGATLPTPTTGPELESGFEPVPSTRNKNCLLYTSDAADEEDSVDLGGRRIIKKKKKKRKNKT